MLRRAWRRNRRPLTWFTAIAVYLLVQQHISNRVLREPGYRWLPLKPLRTYLDGWSQFDGPEYQRIARLGYSFTPGHRSRVVWFPLYPMLMRALHRVTHDYLIAGIIISLVAGAIALCVYWRWLEARGSTGSRRTCAFAVLALYPYGWYLYGAVHADALFLALLVGAFLLVERDRLWLAGLVGALATATRPTGMAAIPALILYGLQREGVLTVAEDAGGLVQRFAVPLRFHRDRLRARSFGPALCVLGLGSYMAYQWVRWDNPILFITNEQIYHPGGRPWLKTAFFWRIVHFGNNTTYTLTIIGQATVALLVVLSIPAVCRRFGFAHGLFLALLVATPTLSTEDFMGTGRYLMAAFPAFALAGERLADRSARDRIAWLGVSGVALAGMGFLFARSVYLT